jgi:hypothetical protein
MKRCRVAYRDSEGIEHVVELEASSLHEAVGLAIDRFRRCEHILYEPKGLCEFIVEPRELTTQHRLTRKMFDEWLRRPGGTSRRSSEDTAEGTSGHFTVDVFRPHRQEMGLSRPKPAL